MAGKHRRTSRPAAVVAMVVAPAGLAAAAMAATSMTGGVATDTTQATAPSVDLAALVSAANSTSQFFAGSTYYGTDWTTVYGTQQVVPFLSGTSGHRGCDRVTQERHTKDRCYGFRLGCRADGYGTRRDVFV